MDAEPASVDYRRLGLIEGSPTPFESLPGYADDNLTEAWSAFIVSCRSIVRAEPVLRPGAPQGDVLREACAAALALPAPDASAIRAFIAQRFQAWRIKPSNSSEHGFLTGYYEPIIPGSWTRSADFAEGLLARPTDLVTLRSGDDRGDLPAEMSGARRLDDGRLAAYPTRAEIDASREKFQPLIYVRDAIEAFMIQVQGSATIRVGDELVHMTYAGRNGRPYTSIGRVLIERGDVALGDMSLARLKQWVRDNGQDAGQGGRSLLWRNESFVFFDIDRSEARKIGPIGGAGTPLSPLRSIAIDRTIWPYGLFFWIDASLPWTEAGTTPFQRLMVGQDTGSAIVGPARADIFMGAGDAAGAIAGGIRHPAEMFVLLPREAP